MNFKLPWAAAFRRPPEPAPGDFTVEEVAGIYRNSDGQALSLNEDGTLDAFDEWTSGRCAEDYDFDSGHWTLTGKGNSILDVRLEYSIGAMEYRYVSYIPRTDSATDTATIERSASGEIELRFVNDQRFVKFGYNHFGTGDYRDYVE